MAELEQDAKERVRAFRPDLVLLSVPRSSRFDSQESFIHSYAWIMNWSLSFGQQEWDCIVVDPDVVEPAGSDDESDELVRRLVRAQDLTLLERSSGDTSDAATVFANWLDREWRFAPTP